jgi:uncharacterized SAM-binding protein YcdF (DUF218 family)
MSKSLGAQWVWRSTRRAAVLVTGLATVMVSLNSTIGYPVYSNAADSALTHVDAVVVLGGEHDGREAYGLGLASRGMASTVLLSNPYRDTDRVMKRMCLRRNDTVDVICSRPDPPTTRGEAIMTRRLARERNWHKILVVTWRYHLPRARLVFDQCLSGENISVAAKAVTQHYELPVWYWQYIYLYQSIGVVKALTTDRC